MKKISKILIVMLVLFLTFATTVLTFAAKTSSGNSDSLVISPSPSSTSKSSIDISPNTSDIDPIRSPSRQIFGMLKVIIIFIAVISIPACIILGILYIKKSKSPKGKKIPLAILIFAIPYILMFITILIAYTLN